MTALTPLAITTIVLVGALTGFTTGLVGAGGTFLALTLLTIMLGDAQLAIGTTLAYAFVVCVSGASAHLRAGRFSPGISLALGVPAACTAVLGAWIAEHLSDRALTLGVAGLAVVVVVGSLAWFGRTNLDHDAEFRPTGATYLGAVLGGLAIGVLQGTFGIAGGFLLLPYLVVVLRVPPRLSVACTLVASIPSLFAAGLSHTLLDNVYPLALGALLLGALPFTWLGAAATGRIPVTVLRNVFVGVLCLSSIALIVLPI